MSKRLNFRKEFPQLCAVANNPVPLSFSHIKDIMEPTAPVKEPTLPFGWIDLRKPETYLHHTYRTEFTTNQLMIQTIYKMKAHWIQFNIEHDLDERYEAEPDYESDYEESETDTMSAEDPEYESDF